MASRCGMHLRRADALPPAAAGAAVAASVLVAAALLALPLLRHAPALPHGDDVPFAVHAAQGFAAALDEGVVRPRWIEATNGGLGAPVFVFYSPLAYYAVGLASLLPGADPLAALRWVAVLAGLLGGLAFVVAFRDRCEAPGLAVGAALYVLAPYHVLDLYWRFAFAEYAAFVWLPLLLLFARRVLEGRGADGVVGLALAWAGLVLTHVVSAFLAPLALAPYVGLRLLRSGRWHRLVPLLGAGALGLALAGAYLLPMVLQRDQVHLEWVREAPYGDYRRNFVGRDEAALGYEPAPVKPLVNRSALVQAGLGAAALGAFALARRRPRGSAACAGDELLAHAGVAVWVLGLQLPLSRGLWDVLPGLPVVQFPWRFQSFQALSGCALAALALSALRPGSPRGRVGLAGLAAAALAWLWVASTAVSPRGVSFGPEQAERPWVRRMLLREYLPRGVEPAGGVPGRLPRARLDGPGKVAVERWDSHERVLRVSAARPVRLQVRTFVYPGWTARVDGEPVPVRAVGPLAVIGVPVPAGAHRVRLSFQRTRDESLGLGASAGAAALTVALALRSRGRRRPSGAAPGA